MADARSHFAAAHNTTISPPWQPYLDAAYSGTPGAEMLGLRGDDRPSRSIRIPSEQAWLDGLRFKRTRRAASIVVGIVMAGLVARGVVAGTNDNLSSLGISFGEALVACGTAVRLAPSTSYGRMLHRNGIENNSNRF